jgi:hypothetical protein
MPGPLPVISRDPDATHGAPDRSSLSADRAYQTLTIAAIVLVLCSLWVF